jgi:predicted NAD/FAD-binding protein
MRSSSSSPRIPLSPKVLEPANLHVYREVTLGQFLKEMRYSRMFTYNYVVPMCAAVWSVPNAQVRDVRGVRMHVRGGIGGIGGIGGLCNIP